MFSRANTSALRRSSKGRWRHAPTAHWQWQMAAVRCVHQYSLALTLENCGHYTHFGCGPADFIFQSLMHPEFTALWWQHGSEAKANALITLQIVIFSALHLLPSSRCIVLLFSNVLPKTAVLYFGSISSQCSLQRPQLWLWVSPLISIKASFQHHTPIRTYVFNFSPAPGPSPLESDSSTNTNSKQNKRRVCLPTSQSQLCFPFSVGVQLSRAAV